MPDGSGKTVHERLIAHGLAELGAHGIVDFSVRRVAKACGISCAAPYKHFADKDDFILAIIEHVIALWEARIPEVQRLYPGNLRRQLVEISLRYVQFLVENAHFRSIIMLKQPMQGAQGAQFAKLRLRLSESSRTLVRAYCDEEGIHPELMTYKLYLIRSLIYGAALMFDNGELPYNERTLAIVRFSIDREFDFLQMPPQNA